MLNKKGSAARKELDRDKKLEKIVKSFRLSKIVCEDFQKKCKKHGDKESHVLEKLMTWYLEEA